MTFTLITALAVLPSLLGGSALDLQEENAALKKRVDTLDHEMRMIKQQLKNAVQNDHGPLSEKLLQGNVSVSLLHRPRYCSDLCQRKIWFYGFDMSCLGPPGLHDFQDFHGDKITAEFLVCHINEFTTKSNNRAMWWCYCTCL